ncbi:OsmC family protein [Psychromonas sp. KJ10-10]|uniref:OsmC family protein n=1 Tax=Psychromonas sp. KJ10-10 TaxID=3391823 RepID=UPI0039B3723D
MQALPHLYNVQVNSTPDTNLIASSKGIADQEVAGPAEFGGPGDQWSPETLILSATASCFVLSFKAVANASKFAWKDIHCESLGKLEKVGHIMKFTEITNKVTLVISDPTQEEMALKLLEKSESICLISNSLNCELKLECKIIIEA